MYSVLLADFPWSYDDKGTGGSQSSSAATKYPTLSIDALMKLPIHSIMRPNFIAFLWVTVPTKFQYVPRVLHAYDLDYRTTIYWHKTPGPPGMGHWFRGDVEELIVATHGDFSGMALRCQERNIKQHPSRWKQANGELSEHSQKPDIFHDLIEKATGEASSRRNIELFARREKPGWRTMGGEISGLDIREELRLEAVKLHGERENQRADDLVQAAHGRSAGAAAGAAIGNGDPVGIV